MNTLWCLVIFLIFTKLVVCRDFYIGMFRRNDFLVAQDVIYKPPAPFGITTTVYGRLFKCPITYFRVVDRLGQGRGPITTIIRGGLRKKYINVRIKSGYRLPISVNIYVGCENKQPSTFRTTRMIPLSTTTVTTTNGATNGTKPTTSPSGNDTATETDATTSGEDGTTATGNSDDPGKVTGETNVSDIGESTTEPNDDGTTESDPKS